MTEFTPLSSTIGGILIGTSAALMYVLSGRVAGISGILGGAVAERDGERPWRITFLAGLLVGGLIMFALTPSQFASSPTSLPWLVVAGLAVGVGTRLGGGCTSGHGVCGLSRFSGRSLVATIIFMAVAAATVFLTHHVLT